MRKFLKTVILTFRIEIAMHIFFGTPCISIYQYISDGKIQKSVKANGALSGADNYTSQSAIIRLRASCMKGIKYCDTDT